MRINWCAHRPPPGFDVGEKAQQRLQIVTFRKSFFLHQPFALEHRVGQKEAIGGDEIDLGDIGPAGKQSLQHSGGGRFADGDRTADADDVWHFGVFGGEKSLLRAKQHLCRGHIEREQPRQGQIDFLDFRHVESVMHRTQPRHFDGLERHRRIFPMHRPFRAREHAIRRHVLLSALLHRLLSALLARCLFLKARLATARGEFGLDLIERNAANVQHD